MSRARRPSPPHAPVEAALALWRGLFLDLPLVWTMELTRFAQHAATAQAEHWARLAACSDPAAAAREQGRFARAVVREAGAEAEALVREAEIALGAAA
ncbi:MAG TPA: hypothetical protein VM434_01065 [Beijerinckiaceae bacterium]|nr:hypothetical protein [Beijerinckiaceae bacterium]